MHAIQKSKSHRGRCTPNVLPCRINHNGAVDTSTRYWNPSNAPEGHLIAYFRGRKLHGRGLRMPKGFKGVVLSKTDRVLPKKEAARDDAGDDADQEEQDDDEIEVKVLEEQSEFDEIVVWGHEAIMDEADPYVRGMEEWIGLAEKINSYNEDEVGTDKTTA